MIILGALLWLWSVLVPSLILHPHWESVFESHFFSYEVVERHEAWLVGRAYIAKQRQNVHWELVQRVTKWIAFVQIVHQHRGRCCSFFCQNNCPPLVAHRVIENVRPTILKVIVSHCRDFKHFDHILNVFDARLIYSSIAHKEFADITFKSKQFVGIDA